MQRDTKGLAGNRRESLAQMREMLHCARHMSAAICGLMDEELSDPKALCWTRGNPDSAKGWKEFAVFQRQLKMLEKEYAPGVDCFL